MIKTKTINDPKVFKGKYYYGLGRRKTSIAKVRLYPGKGIIVVNGEEKNNAKFIEVLKLTNNLDKFNISIVAYGGGFTGWKDAINLGIARALIEYDKNYRQLLKKHGFLKRDSRKVERKKPGLKKARRAPQWQKR